MQAQFKNGANLQFRQLIAVTRNFRFDRFYQFNVGCDFGDGPFARDQCRARFGGACGATDNPHDLVQISHGDDKTKQQMRPFAGLVQLKLCPPGNHFFAEPNERFNDIAQVQDFGSAATNGEHIGGEARLRLGVAPQLVENNVGRGIAL